MEKGVIHGDIKPENILISSESNCRYVVKVTDFGYSTLFTTDSDPITMPHSELWTAPERHHREILPMQEVSLEILEEFCVSSLCSCRNLRMSLSQWYKMCLVIWIF